MDAETVGLRCIRNHADVLPVLAVESKDRTFVIAGRVHRVVENCQRLDSFAIGCVAGRPALATFVTKKTSGPVE